MSEKKKISLYLTQKDNILITKKDCKIVIDLDEYILDDSIYVTENTVWAKNLLSVVEYEDIFFNIILDYAVVLNIYDSSRFTKNENTIELLFNKDEEILTVPLEASQIKDQVNYIKRLLGGKEIYKDTEHLLLKILKIYGSASNMDLVHMEVLLSQCLRDRDNDHEPARLGARWNPKMLNIKDVVFSSGFLQGLAFEDINKSLLMGLISQEDMEQSSLEKLLLGKLVEKKKR